MLRKPEKFGAQMGSSHLQRGPDVRASGNTDEQALLAGETLRGGDGVLEQAFLQADAKVAGEQLDDGFAFDRVQGGEAVGEPLELPTLAMLVHR